MKKVVVSPPAEVAMRTLDADNVRKVHSWLAHLKNWDRDEFVRKRSHMLDSIPGVYVLKTSSDLRIFFKIEENTITILDIGSKHSILTTASLLESE